MRRNSEKYKLWRKNQNYKNLLLRTRKKQRIKNKRTSVANHNHNIKERPIYDQISDTVTFSVPLNFSIINNSEETVQFFNSIINFIIDKNNFGKRIFINLSNIKSLTTDALMYLLALVNNSKDKFKNKCSFCGNEPEKEDIRKIFAESGFYRFVKYKGSRPLSYNNNNVQIMSGEKYDINAAKQITDFICNKMNLTTAQCSFIYIMLIELMNNTQKHAYNDANPLFSKWYCFAEYHSNSKVSFTFMDTGSGIPSTVQKNLSEKFSSLIGNGEYKYVVSALNGEFRTATKQVFRGKGLPQIKDFCYKGVIRDLNIITNKARVVLKDTSFCGTDMATRLQGTLYQWIVDSNELKGGTL